MKKVINHLNTKLDNNNPISIYGLLLKILIPVNNVFYEYKRIKSQTICKDKKSRSPPIKLFTGL